MKSTVFWDVTVLLKMEVICSSETLVDFQRATRCYIPEDGALQKFVIVL
jgi:hypothetical protein